MKGLAIACLALMFLYAVVYSVDPAQLVAPIISGVYVVVGFALCIVVLVHKCNKEPKPQPPPT